MPTIAFHKLAGLAKDLGLVLAGVTDASSLTDDAARLEEWQRHGYAGEMGYMLRSPALLAEPRKLLPSVRSVAVFGVRYDSGPARERRPGQGRIARYAWGRDYHRVLKKRLRRLVLAVEQLVGEPIEHRLFTDAVPLLERALARRAGLGFIGKNTLLIRPGTGSFFFLCEILLGIEVTGAPLSVVEESCGPCRRCQDSCPTGALTSDYRLDARRCISYLTIEKRGALEEWEREAVGEWLFGCDVCQEVCPFNHSPKKRAVAPEAAELRAPGDHGGVMDIESLLEIRDDSAFLERFAGTPLMRAGREGLLRNAAVVAANTRAEALHGSLARRVELDPSPVVRQHALWALWRLAEACNIVSGPALKRLVERCARDPHPSVRAEADRILGA